MRVLIVNKFVRIRGGADRHCLELFDALSDAGHEVAFLSTAAAGNRPLPGAFVPCSVTAEDRAVLGAGDAHRAARRCLWNTTAAAATHRLIDEFAPDVVHLHKLYPQLSVAPAVVATQRELPVVQTLHDYELLAGLAFDDGDRRPPTAAISTSDRALAPALRVVAAALHRPAVDAWVAGSSHVARAYARIGIEAAVLGLPTAAPGGAPLPFAQRRGLVFAGRLAPHKGALDLVELARRAPSLHLSVLGPGPLADTVREHSRRLPNLSVLGDLEPDLVWRRVAGARVAVVPSRWAEPVGLTALEAMAVGTPVVAYRVGGLAEEVGRAGGGMLIAPDPAALAIACLHLHDDEQSWTALSQAGRAHIAREHRPERYVERLVDVYAAAVAG